MTPTKLTHVRLTDPEHIAFDVYRIKTACGRYESRPYLTISRRDWDGKPTEKPTCPDCKALMEDRYGQDEV